MEGISASETFDTQPPEKDRFIGEIMARFDTCNSDFAKSHKIMCNPLRHVIQELDRDYARAAPTEEGTDGTTAGPGDTCADESGYN